MEILIIVFPFPRFHRPSSFVLSVFTLVTQGCLLYLAKRVFLFFIAFMFYYVFYKLYFHSQLYGIAPSGVAIRSDPIRCLENMQSHVNVLERFWICCSEIVCLWVCECVFLEDDNWKQTGKIYLYLHVRGWLEKCEEI